MKNFNDQYFQSSDKDVASPVDNETRGFSNQDDWRSMESEDPPITISQTGYDGCDIGNLQTDFESLLILLRDIGKLTQFLTPVVRRCVFFKKQCVN